MVGVPTIGQAIGKLTGVAGEHLASMVGRDDEGHAGQATEVRPLEGMSATMRRVENLLGRMARSGGRWGRQAGLFPYRPEPSTVERWERDYRSGGLDYFADFDEIARYGVVASYVTSVATRSDVVDLGCGVGLLLSHLQPSGLGRYVGVDMSAAAIERAMPAANERVRFVVGDALSVDLPDCDVVVLNEILYYVAEPGLLLDRIDRCLRPGGRVVTSMWRHAGDWRLWRLMDVRFHRLDMVEVRSRSNTRSRKGWRIACHRSIPSSARREGP